jgi:hypothetical protein
MMDRASILSEIRRYAEVSDGLLPGQSRFEAETGIPQSESGELLAGRLPHRARPLVGEWAHLHRVRSVHALVRPTRGEPPVTPG